MTEQALIRKAGRAAAWSAVARWFDAGASLLSLFVLVRLLGPETYGLYGMTLIALALPSAVVGGPLAECLIQQKNLKRGHEAATFITDLGLSAFCTALLVLAAPLIAAAFRQPGLIPVMQAMAFVPLLSSLGAAPAALLQRDLKFRAMTAVDGAGTVIASTVGIAMALSGHGVWSLVVMELTRRFVRSVGFCVAARWTPSIDVTKADFRDLVRFNAFSVSSRLLVQFDSALPGAIIGGALGPQALGYYHLAQRLFTQGASILLSPLAAVAMPVAAQSQSDMGQLRRVFRQGLRFSTAVAYPFFIGAAAVAPIYVPLFFGREWSGSALVIQLIMLMGVRAATVTFTGGVIRGAGRPGWQTVIVAIGLLATIVILPVAAPFGLTAIVGAVLLRGLVTWIAGAVVLRRIIGFPLRDQILVGWESLIASVVMWLVLAVGGPALGLHGGSWFDLFAAVAIGGVIHVAMMAALAPGLCLSVLRLIRRADRGEAAAV